MKIELMTTHGVEQFGGTSGVEKVHDPSGRLQRLRAQERG